MSFMEKGVAVCALKNLFLQKQHFHRLGHDGFETAGTKW